MNPYYLTDCSANSFIVSMNMVASFSYETLLRDFFEIGVSSNGVSAYERRGVIASEKERGFDEEFPLF